MQSLNVAFPNQSGLSLAGVLDRPATRPRAYALFAHCFSCSSRSHATKRISQALALHGIATLRFDFTGLGQSEGAFRDSHFGANVEDLRSAAAFLSREYGAPSILIGHSLGGAAIIAAAPHIPSVRGVVTLGSPFDPSHALAHFGSALETIEALGEAEVSLGGRPFTVGKDFLQQSRGVDQARNLAALKRPILIMHSPTDEVVGIEQARQIFAAAKHPKSFLSLDGADHLLTDRHDANFVAQMIASWAERYIDEEPAPPIDVGGTVQIRSTTRKFLQDVVAGRHRFVADEPTGIGGDDEGPTPYDFLLTALGTCTAMTVKLFAAREGIPLEDISIGLRHDRLPGQDCDAAMGKLERITREVALAGPLSAEQRKLLLKIADRCPVHRTLEGQLQIVTGEYVSSATETEFPGAL